ncbi:MAG: 23S rRNA (pseudouridine(1915)-N(3))-methyltransferase RlmH [Gammaproteobacteria bacterium]|nr:23S rRNA (pseudouridine(1915)-N(3))-methyltransferase RlmH [Gammaproteobacteria bacterium]
MRLRLLSPGQKMPAWIQQGFAEYAQRMPHECRLELLEIPLGRRARGIPVERAVESEGERILAAIKPGDRVVALEVTAQQFTTAALAEYLENWMGEGRDVCLLVGGPDGLAPACLNRADMSWSLSRLTLPHGLVRVMLAEQLYRAWSLMKGHPYHRA